VTASTTGLSYAQSVDTLGFEVVPNRILSVTLNPSTIRTGGSSNATVTLEGPAPKRGIRVYLESSSPDTVPVPQSLVVPMGQPAATFPLRANANVLGDRVTITARLQRSMSGQLKDATTASSVSSAYLQSRGLEEGEAAPSTAESEAEVAPHSDLPLQAEIGASGETSPSGEAVTDRGIGSSALRRSGTFAQSTKPFVTSPVVTPAPPTAATAPQVAGPPAGAAKDLSVAAPTESAPGGAAVARPAPSSAEILTGPGNTKHAILTIQANVRTAPLAVPRRNLELGR
jgi:hypothetical protein